MRLLVSVRSADEVAAAVAGGAEIVDAKEPGRGALGAVGPDELRGISRVLPAGWPLSVALGDPADEREVGSAWRLLDVIAGGRPLFVKLGLSGVGGLAGARSILHHAVALAASSPSRPAVVAVAYGDAKGPPPEAVIELASEAGARGVLLDTWRKDGRDLFSFMAEPTVRAWAMGARARGLLVAAAGSLSAAGVERAARLPVDVVGVRGAACLGGRNGQVDEALVRTLAAAIRGAGAQPHAVA